MAAHTAKALARSKRGSKTWKDIDQSVKPKAMSAASEKRIWMLRMKVAGAALAIGLVVIGALQLAAYLDRGPELLTKAGESLPIRSVQIETDGSLGETWLLDQLELEEGANLLSVDLQSLKGRLEAIGQVQSAEVERQFPDTLRISVTERRPHFRIMGQRPNGEQLLLFVDAEGHVFEGPHMDPAIARQLPYLDGVRLKKLEQGFAPIPGLEAAARLSEESRTVAQHLYRSWRVVSLERAPLILVRDRTGKEIVFEPKEDFRKQLARLDYIIDYYRGELSSQLSHVDLTLGAQVPVRSAPVRR